MTDLNNITVRLTETSFNVKVNKVDGNIQSTDPITVKNQIQEIHSIDDLGLNLTNRTDGSTLVWNSNTNLYDVKSLFISNSITGVISVNNALFLNNKPDIFFAANSDLQNYYLKTNPFQFVNSTFGVAGSANNSQFLRGKIETQLNANSAVYSTNANFAYTANNASHFNGKLPDYYANATNITTGTLLSSIIPSYVVNTSAAFTISGVHTHTANVVLSSSGYLVFNTGSRIIDSLGSQGTAGKILTSNGSGDIYWSTGPTVSEYIFSTGLTNNNNTISVNSFYIGTLTANNALFLNGNPESELSVRISNFSNLANFATTAFNVNGKVEGNLSVNNAVFANTAFNFNGIIDCGVY
jgi:hypothetical protein